MERINVAEAKRHFSELISRTAAGERFIIQRRGRPVALLIHPEELKRLEHPAQIARRLAYALGQDEALLAQIEQREVHPAMAAFGLWQNDPELKPLTAEFPND